jgi:hypothetical protein
MRSIPLAKGVARYVIEVRDSQGEELISTVAQWTAEERRAAIEQILQWAGMPRAATTKRQRTKKNKDKAP